MVKVKFLVPIVKAGKLRKPGDTMDLPTTAAALLAERGVLEVPGKKPVRKKVEIEVVCFEDIVPQKESTSD